MRFLDEQLSNWSRYRAKIEREIRVLVVDGDRGICKHFDNLLFRSRIPARSVSSAEQALELFGRERYSVLVAAETLPDRQGIDLISQVRAQHPDIDALLTSSKPSVETLLHCLELNIVDVLPNPTDELEQVSQRLRKTVRRSVDRIMRAHTIDQLRESLQQLDADARLRATTALDRRLSGFKNSLGAFDRVLVVEHDSDLRLLSEHLLLAGLHVETADDLQDGLSRLASGDVCLTIMDAGLDEGGVYRQLARLREADPHVAIGLVSRSPSVDSALEALRQRVAAYIPWPPESMAPLVQKAQEFLSRSRYDRLVDNLFVELYRETSRALGYDPNENGSFDAFRQLIGLERVLSAENDASDGTHKSTGAEDYLDDVLSGVLVQLDVSGADSMPEIEIDLQDDAEGSDRRAHPRVMESQFVRFRRPADSASILAYLGDLSEGGVFIRCSELYSPGTIVEVDFNAEYKGHAYLICCRAQVAWVARSQHASAMGPGFGVKFLDPPEDVLVLLQKIVAERQGETSATRGSSPGSS